MGTAYQKGWVRLRGRKWYGYFRRIEIDPSTSEPKAAVWKCHRVEAVALTIVETIYKLKIRPYGKTKGSLTEVPTTKELSEDLIAWRPVSQQQYDGKKKSMACRRPNRKPFCF